MSCSDGVGVCGHALWSCLLLTAARHVALPGLLPRLQLLFGISFIKLNRTDLKETKGVRKSQQDKGQDQGKRAGKGKAKRKTEKLELPSRTAVLVHISRKERVGGWRGQGRAMCGCSTDHHSWGSELVSSV